MSCVTVRTWSSSLGCISMACYKPPVLHVHLPRQQLWVSSCGLMGLAFLSSSWLVSIANGFYIHKLIWPKCLLSSRLKNQIRYKNKKTERKRECLTARESHTEKQAAHSNISLAVIQLSCCWLVGLFIWHGYSFCLIFQNAVTEKAVCWVWVILTDGNPEAVARLYVLYSPLTHCYNEKCSAKY